MRIVTSTAAALALFLSASLASAQQESQLEKTLKSLNQKIEQLEKQVQELSKQLEKKEKELERKKKNPLADLEETAKRFLDRMNKDGGFDLDGILEELRKEFPDMPGLEELIPQIPGMPNLPDFDDLPGLFKNFQNMDPDLLMDMLQAEFENRFGEMFDGMDFKQMFREFRKMFGNGDGGEDGSDPDDEI